MPKTLGIQSPTVRTGYSGQHGYQGNEAPNQTFQTGSFITPTSTGFVEITVGAGAVNKPLKLSLAPGQNAAAPSRRAEYADPREFGVIEITAGGAASTAALLEVGKKYGVAKDPTSGAHYLNLADTTNAVFQIEDARPVLGVVGDTNVRVVASILPANK